MKKHWGRFLLDSYSKILDYKIEDAESTISKIETLEKELKSYQRLLDSQEREIIDYVKDDWTKEEIEEAKWKFNNQENGKGKN